MINDKWGFILRMKHWVFFLLTMALPAILYMGYSILIGLRVRDQILADPYIIDHDPFDIMSSMAWVLVPIMVLYSLVYFWFYAVGLYLQRWVPEGIQMRTKLFRFTSLFPFFFMLLYSLMMVFYLKYMVSIMDYPQAEISNVGVFATVIGVFILFGLTATVCQFHNYYFVAKAIKSAELGREAQFNDYAAEFFLSWFLFVGIWIIQPKLNKWMIEAPEGENNDFIDLIVD